MTNEQVANMLLTTISQFKRMAKHRGPFDGLKPSEVGLLHMLKDHLVNSSDGGIRISELSEKMKVTPPSITQLVTNLESMGLVVRQMDREDRRSVLVSLTEKGEKTTDMAYAYFVSMFTGFVEQVGTEKAVVLNELLGEMIDYMLKAIK
jgi:DNA-binding MarR family transcriptional regulator